MKRKVLLTCAVTGTGSRDVKFFRETVSRARKFDTDIVINLTTAMGAFLLPDPENEGRLAPGSDIVGVDERAVQIIGHLGYAVATTDAAQEVLQMKSFNY